MIFAFIGKGGVGKTSVASAVALNAARKYKTALVSSDFMSSLHVLFPKTPDNLDIIELKQKEVAENWKKRYGKQVLSLLGEFVDVDDWVPDHIANSPGVPDEFMISNIVELEEKGDYEYIIWDTAASSSTMHLLLLQKEFYEHLDRDVRIMLKLKDKFRSKKVSKILEDWKKLAGKVWAELSDSMYYLVTTQDELCLLQTRDIENEFETMGLKIEGRIYNRCRRPVPEEFVNVATVPELEGSAAEIIEIMSENEGLSSIII